MIYLLSNNFIFQECLFSIIFLNWNNTIIGSINLLNKIIINNLKLILYLFNFIFSKTSLAKTFSNQWWWILIYIVMKYHMEWRTKIFSDRFLIPNQYVVNIITLLLPWNILTKSLNTVPTKWLNLYGKLSTIFWN